MRAGAICRRIGVPGKAMKIAVKHLFHWLPLLFGIGFIAPLVAQTLAYWHVDAPFGMRRTLFGLAVGAPWGLYAVWRGRWL